MLSILNISTEYQMANRKSVFDIIEADEKFSILLQILQKTGFGRALRHEEKPFTFLAPTDGAFYQLFRQDADLSITKDSKILITSILGQHLIPGVALYSDDLRRRNSVTTLEGNILEIRLDNHSIFLNDAQIVTAGIAATNGVVFAIDKVLLAGE
jgi:transforming growth factor-beta-induced protein